MTVAAGLKRMLLSMLLLSASGVWALDAPLSPLEAASIQEGHQAYASGDFKKALGLWKPLAEKGNPQAQFYLSNLFANGEGVEQDVFSALSWLTSSANAGFSAAQFNLGNRYYHGRWVEQDYSKAAQWWRKAAENGVPQAAYNLGSLYLQGQGVDKSKDEAMLWYRKAANQGSEEARQALANIDSQPAEQVAEEKPAAASKKTKATTKPEPVKAEAGNVSVATPKESATWIRAQAPKNYTLQVYAASTIAAVEKFIHGYQANDRLAVFGFVRDGKPMYAVVQGSYGSMQEAQSAASSLTGVSSWVRRFSGIHQIMSE